MFRFSLFFLLLLISVKSFGQNIQNPCYTKTLSALNSLPDLYTKGDRNAVDSLLFAWKYDCGDLEFNNRLRTLLQIKDGTFIEYDFDFSDYNAMIEYLEDTRFRLLMDSVHENPRDLFRTYFSEPDVIFTYDKFTQQLALEIAKEKNIDLALPSCETDIMLLQLYSNTFNPFFKSIKDSNCKSILTKNYTSQLSRIMKRSKVDMALLATLWIPNGNASLLGNHAGFGFIFGFGKGKILYDFDMEFRFGKAKNTYNVFYQGAITPTNYFFGGYFGLDIGYELASVNKSKFYLITGIGADGFDCIESDTKNDVKGKSIFVLNLNAGLGWRKFSKDGAYIGIEARNNFVNYKNTGGTSLDGDAVSIRLLIGLLKNERQSRELSQMKNIFN